MAELLPERNLVSCGTHGDLPKSWLNTTSPLFISRTTGLTILAAALREAAREDAHPPAG